MTVARKTTRVALARFWPGALFGLEEALEQEQDLAFFALTESPGELWKRALMLSADLVILLTPDISAEILHCVDTLLKTTAAAIFLVSGPAGAAPQLPGERLHSYRITGSNPDQPEQQLRELMQEIRLFLGHQARGKNAAPAEKAAPNGGRIAENVLQNTIIAIGSSTGGTEALRSVFMRLPPQMPGIVVVQHMPPVFTEMFAQRLNSELPFQVQEAQHHKLIQPSSIHIAPGDRHLEIERRGGSFYTKLVDGPKVSGHCPSVDQLFYSVARAARQQAVGIILTGMGADGADGMLAMREAGAFNIGQDEKSSVVYGMPCKAYENGAVNVQSGLTEIAAVLLSHLAGRR